SRNSSQRVQGIGVLTMSALASLSSEQLLTGAHWIDEVCRAPARNQRCIEDRQRYARVFLVHLGAAGGHQMHAHFTTGANICKLASITNVPTLDHPDLARRRIDLGDDLIRNQTERAIQVRTAAEFVEDLPYLIVYELLHCCF